MKHVIGYTRKGRPVYAIAGGSGTDAPPVGNPNPEGGVTIPANAPAAPPAAPASGEQPPATPAPTSQVDPAAFQRGNQDAADAAADAARGTTNPQTGRTFTEAEVERIRQEEKDKVYGRVSDLTEELKREREEREAEKRARAEEEARAEEARRREGEKDLDVRELLTRKEQEWTDRFNQIEAQRETDRALLDKEREFNALQEYKRNILAQHEDDIMPELRDLVDGNNEAEIQAAAQRAIEKTNGIMQNIQAVQQQHVQATPTARVTQPGAGGPLEQAEGGQRTYSAQELRGLSMAEYAQHRNDLLAAASKQYRGQ